MKIQTSIKILSLIQALTDDEDLIQDLWVNYLENKSISALLCIINKEHYDEDKTLDYCWQLCYYDSEDIYKELLWL